MDYDKSQKKTATYLEAISNGVIPHKEITKEAATHIVKVLQSEKVNDKDKTQLMALRTNQMYSIAKSLLAERVKR